jgi:hypothetical protein
MAPGAGPLQFFGARLLDALQFRGPLGRDIVWQCHVHPYMK